MSKIICRICLRTDINTRDIQETLVDFHDEISEYAVYENSALKYCSICEYLLLKFYNFSRKCRKANKILRGFKREKNRGFPSHLHELLPPTSLGPCVPSTVQQFNLNNGNLEPLHKQLLVKQENDTEVLENDLKHNDDEAIDTLPTNDVFQENELIDEHGDSYVEKIYNVSDILDDQQGCRKNKTLAEMTEIDLRDENKRTQSEKDLSKIQSNFKKTQKPEEHNIDMEVKLEDYSSDLQENDCNEDSSDTEMINEFKKRIQAISKTKLRKIGSPIKKQQRLKQPLRNHKEYENVFDIQLFATDEEAKEELELRKTSEPYLSAEHKCGICYTVYKYAKLLEFHMRWHNPSAGDHECGVCRMRFKSKRAAASHKYSSHYGKFTCKKCSLITYHKGAMETHYQHHVGVIFACKLCDHTFNHISTYKTHLRLRHKTDHVCVTCARTFVSEKGLYAHRNIIHKTKSKEDSNATAHCAPCGLTFANEQVYTVHIMNTEKHTDLATAIVACKVCGVRFEDKEDLKEHRRSQHPKYNTNHKLVNKTRNKTADKDAYKCTICGVMGTSHLWVFKHIASAHPDSPYVEDLAKRRQYMCDTCGKCYTTIYALRDHMNTHSGAKPYACALCPARFGSRSYLTLHQDWHEPAKRECPRCGKKFVTASNLSNHMRFHIQDRRFKCSVCDKGFLHAGTMREHVRGVHHNVRRARKGVKRET